VSTTLIPVPHKASRLTAVPWQFSVSKELTVEEMQVVVQRFLSGTTHDKVISGDVYPGLTIFNGERWLAGSKGKGLAQVAARWDEVAEDHGDLLPDATLELRITSALQDEVAAHEVIDLTAPPQ
jgi:hypothetical protein